MKKFASKEYRPTNFIKNGYSFLKNLDFWRDLEFIGKIRFDRESGIFLYLFIFICLTTSSDWNSPKFVVIKGEIFRFDKINISGHINIYYIFAFIFLIILLLRTLMLRKYQTKLNFLKTIFLLYLIPVSLLQYLCVLIKNIELKGLGIQPIAVFFVFTITVFFVQDVFLKNKTEKQLDSFLTIIQIFIFLRGIVSLIRYNLGYGQLTEDINLVRSVTETDFLDFLILLFVISFTRLLFQKNVKIFIFSSFSMILSSYLIIFSYRRFAWVELIVVFSIISLLYFTLNKKKLFLVFPLFTIIVFISLFFANHTTLKKNIYIGRLLTSFSLFDKSFESEFGTQMGHIAEIKDGIYNVKNHWLLGVTPFGIERIERPYKSQRGEPSLFIHNAYLQIWLLYGLLGFVLFITLYIKSLKLGYEIFLKYKDIIGMILLSFFAAQLFKNIVWPTAIKFMNITIIYIVLISIGIRYLEIKKA